MIKGKNISTLTRQLVHESIDKAFNNLIEDKSFQRWKTVFGSYLKQEISELQENYLNNLNLKIRVSSNYEFSGRKARWLAAYEKSAQGIKHGIVSIAINYKHLYEEMKKRDIAQDDFNIEAQARITIGHEIGHGLVDYIKTTYRNTDNNKTTPNLMKIFNCSPRQEEEMVEEFGEAQFPQATSVYGSVIEEALEELSSRMGV